MYAQIQPPSQVRDQMRANQLRLQQATRQGQSVPAAAAAVVAKPVVTAAVPAVAVAPASLIWGMHTWTDDEQMDAVSSDMLARGVKPCAWVEAEMDETHTIRGQHAWTPYHIVDRVFSTPPSTIANIPMDVAERIYDYLAKQAQAEEHTIEEEWVTATPPFYCDPYDAYLSVQYALAEHAFKAVRGAMFREYESFVATRAPHCSGADRIHRIALHSTFRSDAIASTTSRAGRMFVAWLDEFLDFTFSQSHLGAQITSDILIQLMKDTTNHTIARSNAALENRMREEVAVGLAEGWNQVVQILTSKPSVAEDLYSLTPRNLFHYLSLYLTVHCDA